MVTGDVGRFVGCPHRHVDIFKNQAGSDALAAVGGLDQIVTGLAVMFAPECIDEDERFSELASFDQEAGAINFPCSRVFLPVPFGLVLFGGGIQWRQGCCVTGFAMTDFQFQVSEPDVPAAVIFYR